MRMFKEDCELLELENCSLKESNAIFEASLERISGQHARLMGHNNHKQKIQYMLKLKDENGRLRRELKESRHRALQLDSNRRSCNLIDALAPLGSSSLSPTSEHSVVPLPKRRSIGQYTPKHSNAASTLCAQIPRRSLSGPAIPEGSKENSRVLKLERRCHLQNRNLERIGLDFQHFRALIERAITLSDPIVESSRSVADSDVASLLQQLRAVVAKRAPAGHAEGERGTAPAIVTFAPPKHNQEEDDTLNTLEAATAAINK